MDAKKTLLFILLEGMIHILVLAAEENSAPSRSALFTTEENKRLAGHVVKRFESPSLMSCSHSCLRNAWCTSTNFKEPTEKKGKGTCELNKHGAIEENRNLRDEQGVTFSALLKGCQVTGCLNGGFCVLDEKEQTFSCSCKASWYGHKCETKIDAPSCDKLAQTETNQKLPDGKYLLLNETDKFEAYCHMTNVGEGWTLIARFSNSDDKNWMNDTGSWWYDQKVAMGTTTSPLLNTDMISPAFWLTSGKEFKITSSDDPSHTPLLQTNGSCLAGQTFRSKITSYGDFRNGKVWASYECLGNCTVQYGGQYKSIDGFQQAECSESIRVASKIGFWCNWEYDGSVMMIGGGGRNCSRADHGIGITEADEASFNLGSVIAIDTEYDFGNNAETTSPPTQSYSLNLWIR